MEVLTATPIEGVKTLGQIESTEFTTHDWLVEDLIPRQAVTILAGSGGSGKSTLLKLLALYVANGTEHFLSKPLHVDARRAVILSTEEGTRSIKRALDRLPDALKEAARERVVFIQKDFKRTLTAYLQENTVDFAGVDPAGAFFKSGNDSSSVRQELQFFDELSREHDVAMVCVHHTRKAKSKDGTKEDLLGSISVSDAVRSVLLLEQKADGKFLKVVKSNEVGPEMLERRVKIDLNGEIDLTAGRWERILRKKSELDDEDKVIISLAAQEHQKKGVPFEKMPPLIEEEFGVSLSKSTINNWVREYSS